MTGLILQLIDLSSLAVPDCCFFEHERLFQSLCTLLRQGGRSALTTGHEVQVNRLLAELHRAGHVRVLEEAAHFLVMLGLIPVGLLAFNAHFVAASSRIEILRSLVAVGGLLEEVVCLVISVTLVAE